ncbi:hypothetical protein [Streptomyces anandii]|uniref:hypothetical protein n=1 Tax=Streptomyces anandii TaxID=285454 RepID=UPI0016783209|nr:hypothetical protein [Streptomyces anandii]GGX94695.1 hypothetical protein GCM10010510_44880 [Streptomyces anandii JCM 4720]
MTAAAGLWVCAECGEPCRDDAALAMHEYLRHGVFPEGSERHGEPDQTRVCRKCREEHGADKLAVSVHRQFRHPRQPRSKPRPDDLTVPYVPPMRFGGHRSRHDTPPSPGVSDD